MTLTLEQIQKALPLASAQNVQVFGSALISGCATNGIDTAFRKAAFLSQIGYESQWFTHTSENLYYSPQGLMSTWPHHFPTLASTVGYAHNPEKIANKVYAGRYGNGDEVSGDGWKYRGRGLIQLTFKDNYRDCSIGHDLVADPDFIAAPQGAVDSALWFWKMHHLSVYADTQNITEIIQRISGGTINLSQRTAAYHTAMIALGS